MPLLLTGGTLYRSDGPTTADLLIDAGRIRAIGTIPQSPKPLDRLDCTGLSIVPGFIDTHVHGANGVDIMDGADAIRTVARFKARHGTTAFVPTTVTAPVDRLVSAAQEIVAAASQQQTADGGAAGEARVVGAHIEGPFLNSDFAGAQPTAPMMAPDLALVEQLAQILGSLFKMMTLAPELPGAESVIRRLAALGVRPSAGHTAATSEQLAAATDAGLRSVTHTFNAMRGIHHRQPGIPGAACSREELMCELIADGVHIHAEVLRLYIRAKGPAGCILVTDAIAATGMPDGRYTLGTETVTVAAGVCRAASGALAGSTLTMDQGVRHLVQTVGLPLEEAIWMASTNPARALGLDDRGSIAEDKQADLVLLNADLQVQQTIIAGRVSDAGG